MNRPRLLDLFCGAGGATKGYQMAGFYVVGVDNRPQPHYCGDEFHQADALKFVEKHGQDFSAIHASPPCQAFCALRFMPNLKKHVNLIPQTREALRASGLPYVIENVVGAPLIAPVMLCGTMFGLETSCGAQLRRHRLFETNWLLMRGLQCRHLGRTNPWITKNRQRVISIAGHAVESQRNRVRETFPVEEARVAMGIDWMPLSCLSQAIPPAYTEFIGIQLLLVVGGVWT